VREQVGAGSLYRNDDSDNEREESDCPDGGSGAEVKGDSDYEPPTDLEQD
jgi:hypothetical protein